MINFKTLDFNTKPENKHARTDYSDPGIILPLFTDLWPTSRMSRVFWVAHLACLKELTFNVVISLWL